MPASIRHQILIPLFAVQLATVATIAVVAARVAADRVEGQVADRLEGVVETLGRSNFPLTGGVLAKMRGLSGAHFATSDESGRLLDSTLPSLKRWPTGLRPRSPGERLHPVGSLPKLNLEGEGYFAESVRPGEGPTLLILYPESAWRRGRWDASLPPLAVGAISLAPMAAVTGIVAHRLGVRLKSVQERVASIASGDFREVDGPSEVVGDEVSELVRSVQGMATKLRGLEETIRRTERVGALAQLAAGLAHQLRNAATGARMAVQLHARRCPAASGDGSLEVALRQLSICEDQVRRLFSTDRGPVTASRSFDPGDLVNEVATLVGPNCRHLGVDLKWNRGDGSLLLADREALCGALLNLTQNAMEAAGPGGRVELSMQVVDDFTRFDVIDDGPGPSPELVATMFEPFVTGKSEGLGLGLVVARRVADESGGSLSWSRVGSRTRFRLEVPRAEGVAPA